MRVDDPCYQKIVSFVIRAGKVIREIKGIAPTENVTILFNETAPLFGLPTDTPAPIVRKQDLHKMFPFTESEEDKQKNESVRKWRESLPSKVCERCGGRSVLHPICRSCRDSESGKYQSGYRCEKCGLIFDKSEKFFTQVMDELKIEIGSGTKESLGIKTITDDGLK